MAAKPTPVETRVQDALFVRQCSLPGLAERLPLRWATPPDVPPSPKRDYRSHYVYLGWKDLSTLPTVAGQALLDPAGWEHLSDFDLALLLIDFSGLRPVLAKLLGWTSARGRTPFDPLSMFLLQAWQIVNDWTRAETLRNLRSPRYADYAQRFGFQDGVFPTEGGMRYFLTTLGLNSDADGDTVTVELNHDQQAEIAVEYLNQLIVGAVDLLCEANLITPEAWEKALVCPDGMIHDAASRMRCTSVQDSCYQPTSSDDPRPCPAKEKGKKGCDCDTLDCAQSCRQAPTRDPEARCIYYTGSNQSSEDNPNASTDPSATQRGNGELRYGYRSLTLQFAEPNRRFSFVLLDDFLSANAREENPATALLLQLERFYPDLGLYAVSGDAGVGYYAFLHATHQLGARRVIDLRSHTTDKDKSQWPLRGYNDVGRPVCSFGYAFTANGFDAERQRHKWFCGQACLNGATPIVELDQVTYPPEECPYQKPDHPHGKIINLGETFEDGSIRLVRDLPVGTLTWKRLYHRARNASEYRNSVLEGWGFKRLRVYGKPRNKALTALADVWLNLTTLARLVREATTAARTLSG